MYNQEQQTVFLRHGYTDIIANLFNDTTEIDNTAGPNNLTIFSETIQSNNITNDNNPDKTPAIVTPIEEIPLHKIENNIVLAPIIYKTMVENNKINISIWQQSTHPKY